MLELTRAQQWLYTHLQSNVAINAAYPGRVYASPAPQETAKDSDGRILPYILIDDRAGTDTTAGSGVRIGSQLVFSVEIVSETQATFALEGSYDAIDSALQGLSGTHRGLIIDLVQRDSSYMDWGVESGSPRRHVGALWRLFVRPQT